MAFSFLLLFTTHGTNDGSSFLLAAAQPNRLEPPFDLRSRSVAKAEERGVLGDRGDDNGKEILFPSSPFLVRQIKRTSGKKKNFGCSGSQAEKFMLERKIEDASADIVSDIDNVGGNKKENGFPTFLWYTFRENRRKIFQKKGQICKYLSGIQIFTWCNI